LDEPAGAGGKKGASHVTHPFQPVWLILPVEEPTSRNESI